MVHQTTPLHHLLHHWIGVFYRGVLTITHVGLFYELLVTYISTLTLTTDFRATGFEPRLYTQFRPFPTTAQSLCSCNHHGRFDYKIDSLDQISSGVQPLDEDRVWSISAFNSGPPSTDSARLRIYCSSESRAPSMA